MLRLILLLTFLFSAHADVKKEIVSFPNGKLTLKGELYKPEGSGPFPTLLYNHGSAPKMLNSKASEALGPFFAKHGWIFFMPYRRGQGLSENAGPYIGDEIERAEGPTHDLKAGALTMLRLLKSDHLEDQMAAYNWIQNQKFVMKSKIAVQGNSFGGIETILGIEKLKYCAAVDVSGGSQSWESSPELQEAMKEAVRVTNIPVFFFQAENDYSLLPNKVLSAILNDRKKSFETKTYPKFGKTPQEGHSFAYMGLDTWGDDVIKFLSHHCLK